MLLDHIRRQLRSGRISVTQHRSANGYVNLPCADDRPEQPTDDARAAFQRGAWWHVGLFGVTVLLSLADVFLLEVLAIFLALLQAVVIGLWFGAGRTNVLIKLPILLACALIGSHLWSSLHNGAQYSGDLLAMALWFAIVSATARMLGLKCVLQLPDGRDIVFHGRRQFSIAQLMIFTAVVAVLLATFRSGIAQLPLQVLTDWQSLTILLPIGCVLAATAWSTLSNLTGFIGVTLTYSFLAMIGLGLIMSPNAASVPCCVAVVGEMLLVSPFRKYLQRDLIKQGTPWKEVDGIALFFLIAPINAVVFGCLNPSALVSLGVVLLQIGIILSLLPFRQAGFRLQWMRNHRPADDSPDLRDSCGADGNSGDAQE